MFLRTHFEGTPVKVIRRLRLCGMAMSDQGECHEEAQEKSHSHHLNRYLSCPRDSVDQLPSLQNHHVPCGVVISACGGGAKEQRSQF
jgi:hypothetical protein